MALPTPDDDGLRVGSDPSTSGATGRYEHSVSPGPRVGVSGRRLRRGRRRCTWRAGRERLAGTVVAHRGARVGMRGGFLHVPERDASVRGGGDERVTQAV